MKEIRTGLFKGVQFSTESGKIYRKYEPGHWLVLVRGYWTEVKDSSEISRLIVEYDEYRKGLAA